ncbi:hypothetical protein BACCIP111899_01082 [Bacillus rhizoplanae]|uniref:DUF3995 domain-containing protein n=1 Tax=Bacillus rhizoplanae TaxID=2880966 RepID=A0ABM8Y886_9BACI|nr:DUF3995 domain-containing protein [Bacillus rhizoplanae]CAG9611910.1 hypothetical protein BACCIP111899_01082 [Bacillus rhizoplanae]
MISFLIIVDAGILAFISLIHMYWACGGTWGSKVVLPMKKDSGEYAFIPHKTGTFLVALAILCFAMMLLAQSGYLSFWNASRYTKWGCMILAGIFFLRAVGDRKYVGIFKKVKGTKFSVYDTWLYSPLCLYIALSFFVAVYSQ